MKNKESWRRASFTVEAAVIVPMSVIMLALLLGFDYFMHQAGWCLGSSAESALYSVQRFADSSTPEQKAQERADSRVSETPLTMGQTSETASSSTTKVTVSWEADILPSVFGSLYDMAGSVSVMRLDPVSLKQSTWVIGDTLNEE